MADTLNTEVTLGGSIVTPIYDAMLWRASDLLASGAILDAADMLATAAETMCQFDHPKAACVASWARELLESWHGVDHLENF